MGNCFQMRNVIVMISIVCSACAANGQHIPRRVTMLEGSAATEALSQCSRRSPTRGSDLFTPSGEQADMVDRAVAASKSPPPGVRDLSDLRRLYAVELVGIVRGDARAIYANYYPLAMQEGVKTMPARATVVCDGGPSFFGAEVDAATGRLIDLSFNGSPGMVR
jgi:hypothetical protein